MAGRTLYVSCSVCRKSIGPVRLPANPVREMEKRAEAAMALCARCMQEKNKEQYDTQAEHYDAGDAFEMGHPMSADDC